MGSLCEYLREGNCFDCTTSTELIEECWKYLRDNLSNPQIEKLIQLIDEKDTLIINTARNNYESGFLDGVELLTIIYNRRWNGDDG